MLHRDSLGSEQLSGPGQLNLMTAGAGVAHAEEAHAASYRRPAARHPALGGPARGDAARRPAFEHHADLPQVDLGAGEATVLVGDLGGTSLAGPRATPTTSAPSWTCGPAPTDRARSTPGYEHALVVLDGAVERRRRRSSRPGALAYLGTGRDELRAARSTAGPGGAARRRARSRSEILMWWNFVARTRDEIDEARTAWQGEDRDRFGPVTSRLGRIDAPGLPWS